MGNLPLNIDLQQILLHALNFVLLFGILWFLLYKPVKEFIEKRNAYYRDRDAETDRIRQQTEALKAEYERKLSAAEAEVTAQREKAEEEAAAEAKRIVEKARADAAQILERARADVEKEHTEMLRHAGEEISGLAAKAAEQIVFRDPKEAYDGFLDAALRENRNE